MAVSYRSINDRFRRRWPGIEAYATVSTLAELAKLDAAGIEALVERASAADDADAASLLMATVASGLATLERSEHKFAIHGVGELVRAGGDPAPALDALVTALEDYRVRDQALRALRMVALRGWPLEAIRQRLDELRPRRDNFSSRAAQRLASLQGRGRSDDVKRLGAVYKAHPLANLFGGIGLLEELMELGRPDDAQMAERCLTELEAAGPDLYLAWIALLPVLRRQLRADSALLRRDAARAIGQVRFSVDKSDELNTTQAAEQLTAPLTQVLPELIERVEQDEAAVAAAAAKAVEICVGLGASLESPLTRVEALLAVSADSVNGRDSLARALSVHLRRVGREKPLPVGFSYRRTYAERDEPVRPGRTVQCGHCESDQAYVIYEHNDGMQFYSTTTTEYRCPSCKVYQVDIFQAPG